MRADRLVEIFQPLRNLQKFYVCYPDYLDFCASQRSFTDLALTCNENLILTGQGDAAELSGTFVSGNYFRTLGRAILARNAFGPETDQPDVSPVERQKEMTIRASLGARSAFSTGQPVMTR